MPNKLIQADIRKNVDGKKLEENVNESLVDEVFEPAVENLGISEGLFTKKLTLHLTIYIFYVSEYVRLCVFCLGFIYTKNDYDLKY